MWNRSATGRTSRSMPRSRIEYGGCSVTAETAPFGGPLVLDDAVRRERRGAERPDLALPLQIGQRGERLVVVGARVRAVHLVEVYPIGLQPAQAVLDLLHHPAAGVAPLVGIPAGGSHGHVHRTMELGCEDHILAAPGQRLTHDGLRLALGIDVGGVDEVDPGVKRPMDDGR